MLFLGRDSVACRLRRFPTRGAQDNKRPKPRTGHPMMGRAGIAKRHLQSSTVQAFRETKDRLTHSTEKVPPFSVLDLEITVVCNLRCPFCYFWGSQGTSHRAVELKEPRFARQLTREEIFDMLKPLRGSKLRIYLSSAGEPFYRKDTIDIIEDISSLGFTVSFTTNGTLITDELADRIIRCPGLRNFIVSIDGPEDVHDLGRGKGNFRRTMDNIGRLRAKSPDKPRVWVNATMTQATMGRTVELGRIVRDAGFDHLRFQHLWFADRSMLDAHSKALLDDFGEVDTEACGHLMEMPGPEYGRSVVNELISTERALWPFVVYQAPRLTPEEGAKYYSDPTFSVSDHCGKPWTGLNIRADGTVVFCPDQWINWPIGHVRQESLDTIWRGDKAMFFRRALDKRGLYPGCIRCPHINLKKSEHARFG